MTSTVVIDKAAPTRKVKYGSMSRDRTWALRWSYFFLTLFVIFSLVPPLYMLITSLKSSAEISAATNPWWVFHPTLSNYIELLTRNQFLRFFLNSAMVSIFVVMIAMLISVPAAFALSRMRFWGSATLATGVFLTYLIPDTLLFLPLFKMFAVFDDGSGIVPDVDAYRYSGGAAGDHRCDHLRLHGVLGPVPLSAGVYDIDRSIGAAGRHHHEPDQGLRLQLGTGHD